MRNSSQKKHDTLLKSVADYLELQNYSNVKACVENRFQPDEIIFNGSTQDYVPDASGTGAIDIIVEVETNDSIYDDITSLRWKYFSDYAKCCSKHFCIVVPQPSFEVAKELAEELNVSAEILCWPIF